MITRHPYDARRLEALVAFSEVNRLSPVFSLPPRRMITTLAARDGVVELRTNGRTALVAVVVDGCDNVHDAAVVEVLGWDSDVPLAPLLAFLEPIVAQVGAARPRLSLALPVTLAAAIPPGWVSADASLVMERPPTPWEPPVMPAEARWENLHKSNIEEHYRVVRAAFVGDPSTFIPDLATFTAANLGCDPPVRVLRIGATEAGFARTSYEDGDVGYVASIGRAPGFRGQALGPVVLAEALRMLSRRRVSRFRLGVTASNAAAVALYLRFGFTVVERWQAWHRERSPLPS